MLSRYTELDWAVFIAIPIMLLFLIIGLLLYVFYLRPDLMLTDQAISVVQSFEGKKVTVFMWYVLHEIPSGVRGLVTIGIIAAALSTLNSGLSSMSSVIVQDIYRPFCEQRERSGKGRKVTDAHFVKAGQFFMILVALALAVMAILSFYWQQYSDTPLLTFALSVMLFSYSGLLGVYFTALFTQRGSERSVLAALITGFVVTLLMQPYMQTFYLSLALQFDLAFTWKLCIATLISTLVCMIGQRKSLAKRTAFTLEVHIS